jgi:hypothetical protein
MAAGADVVAPPPNAHMATKTDKWIIFFKKQQ